MENPEMLHEKGKTEQSPVSDKFVTPGIPNAMASKEDRKTGKVSDRANSKLMAAIMQPGGNGNGV
jgi:hypothetical protein